MTRNDLITLLLSMPGENPKVALVDLNKNLAAYTGSKEVPTDGLYERFKVQSGGKGPEDIGIFILFDTTEYYAVKPDIHEVNKCMEKNCTNIATKEYNGHGHFVCDYHMKRLSDEFDNEYK